MGNHIFNKGDRVQTNLGVYRTVYGTVDDPETPYGMVKVNWDSQEVEEDHLREWDLTRTNADEERDAALEEAKELLSKYGYAFRIWGPEDVHRMLDSYAVGEPNYDTVTHRDEITQFIMNADGWWKTLPEVEHPEAFLWKIVDSTYTEHPEWFPVV